MEKVSVYRGRYPTRLGSPTVTSDSRESMLTFSIFDGITGGLRSHTENLEEGAGGRRPETEEGPKVSRHGQALEEQGEYPSVRLNPSGPLTDPMTSLLFVLVPDHSCSVSPVLMSGWGKP